jgi:hypothetical protein
VDVVWSLIGDLPLASTRKIAAKAMGQSLFLYLQLCVEEILRMNPVQMNLTKIKNISVVLQSSVKNMFESFSKNISWVKDLVLKKEFSDFCYKVCQKHNLFERFSVGINSRKHFMSESLVWWKKNFQ